MSNLRTVAALYIDAERGPYASMPGVEAWGVERDARLYEGPHPVVAHPPCQAWGGLRLSRQHLWHRNGWARADFDRDGAQMACGPIAVRQVRQWGGVLEHPASSALWPYCGMPSPGLLVDAYGGRTVEVWQGAFGHDAPKRTWLYCVGIDTDELDLRTSMDGGGRVESMWSSERHITPGPFASLLVEMARSASKEVVA